MATLIGGIPFRSFPLSRQKFELRVKHLHLSAEMYTSSRALHGWCERNRNRLYVPEWLLEEWGMIVNLNFTAAA